MALTKVTTGGITDATIATADIADEAITLAKLPHGTSSNNGKFLRANNGADPTFETVTGTTINNNADNRVITGSGTANTLEGEANLTFTGGATGDATLTVHAEENDNASEAFLKLETSNDFAESVVTAHDSSGVGGSLKYNHGDNAWRFTTNSDSERMRINSSGKVGIGTASPVSILHLHETGSDGSPIIQFSNGDTGATTGDGFAIGVADNESPFIYNRENTDLRIATNNTERLRILAGGGLTFNGDTAAANALDDYEEGTWTPVIGEGSVTTIGNNTYTKIGNRVTINILAMGFSDTSSSSGIHFTGLPFTSASSNGSVGSAFTAKININDNVVSWVGGGVTTLNFFDHGQGDYDHVRHDNITGTDTTRRIFATVTYQAA